MKKSLIVLPLVLILVVAGIFVASRYFAEKQNNEATSQQNDSEISTSPEVQNGQNSAKTNPSMEGKIYYSLQEGKSSPEGVKIIDVVAQTVDSSIYNTDVYVSFDPALVSISNIEDGNFFEEPIVFQHVIRNTGEIYYAVGSTTQTSGNRTLFSFSVTNTSGQASTISLMDKTFAVGKDAVHIPITYAVKQITIQ
jgi:hypothetical protein